MSETFQISSQKKILGGVFFSLLVCAAAMLISPKLIGGDNDDSRALNFFISRLYLWLALLLVWIYCAKLERNPFLLWKDKEYSGLMSIVSVIALIGAVFVGVLIVGVLLLHFGIPKESEKLKMMVVLFQNNMLLMFFTTISAGVIEELIFRGYLLPRLIAFIGVYGGIIVSSVLFALMHIGYGNIIQVIAPGIIGAIFAIYYVKFRNLKILIFTHFLWDTLVLLLRMAIEHLRQEHLIH